MFIKKSNALYKWQQPSLTYQSKIKKPSRAKSQHSWEIVGSGSRLFQLKALGVFAVGVVFLSGVLFGSKLFSDENQANQVIKFHKLTRPKVGPKKGKKVDETNRKKALHQLRMIERNLDGYLDESIGRYSIPALALAIYQLDKPYYQNYRGFDPNERRALASLTKTFTAIAIMQLVERGKIRLDDNIRKYFPKLKVAKNPRKNKAITVRRLLRHQSGLPYTARGGQNVKGRVSKLWCFVPNQVAAAGTEFIYSNHNYQILAPIIEHASGMRYDDYVREKILKPLEMKETRIFKYANGASGLHSTISDLAHFALALIKGGKYKGKRIISEKSIRLMYEMPEKTKYSSKKMDYYGLGVRVVVRNGKIEEIYHTGLFKDIFSEFRLFPKLNSYVIQIGNPPHFNSDPMKHHRYISNHYARQYVKLLNIAYVLDGNDHSLWSKKPVFH